MTNVHPKALTDPEAPREVREAVEARDEAREALQEAQAVHRDAERKAGQEIPLLRGERERWRQEVAHRTANERQAARRADAAARRADKALAAVVEEHGDKLRSIAARRTLAAHADEVDALLDAGAAASRKIGPVVPRHPGVPDYEPDPFNRVGGSADRSRLETLDLLNTRALMDLAGDDCGMVGVRANNGLEIWTTPRRAAALVGGGGHGRRDFRHVDEIEEV